MTLSKTSSAKRSLIAEVCSVRVSEALKEEFYRVTLTLNEREESVIGWRGGVVRDPDKDCRLSCEVCAKADGAISLER